MPILKFVASRLGYETTILSAKGKRFKAYVADSFLKQMIGLMYRKRLVRNECMLFVFGSETEHGIWMKNMLFPIDVAWLDSDMKTVHVEKNLKPCRSFAGCKTYYGGKSSRFVLEFSSGTVSRLRLRLGDAFSVSK